MWSDLSIGASCYRFLPRELARGEDQRRAQFPFSKLAGKGGSFQLARCLLLTAYRLLSYTPTPSRLRFLRTSVPSISGSASHSMARVVTG